MRNAQQHTGHWDVLTQHNSGFGSFFDMERNDEVRAHTQNRVGHIINPDALDDRNNGLVFLH